MSKTKRNVALLFLFSVSILVLTWCQKNTNTENNNVDQNTEQSVAQIEQKLVINNWCVGCGRCIKNAPQNFTMNWRIAEVISQENIDSQLVDSAIKNCPVSVIEIIEV